MNDKEKHAKEVLGHRQEELCVGCDPDFYEALNIALALFDEVDRLRELLDTQALHYGKVISDLQAKLSELEKGKVTKAMGREEIWEVIALGLSGENLFGGHNRERVADKIADALLGSIPDRDKED